METSDNNRGTNHKKEHNKEYNKALAVGIISIALGIIVFLLGNILGAIYSVTWIEATIIGLIIVGFGVISWVIVAVIVWYLVENGCGILKNLNVEDERSICNITNLLCCYYEALEKIDSDLVDIDPIIQEKERVHSAKEINTLESAGGWKYIWIFSEDLATEVDNGRAELVLINNCNNGTQYKMFYLDTEDKRSEINERKENILNSLSSRGKKNVIFCPIKNTGGYIGCNTLPLLCGSIMFSERFDEEMGEYFKCGYLSLRKDLNHTPVYYKMPKCMLDKYTKYFKNIC